MPCATIAQTTAAVPPHRLTQDDIKRTVRELFPMGGDRLEAAMAFFDGAKVASRYSVLPLEELRRRRGLTETMALYRECALPLGRQVANGCLQAAGLRPDEIDLVITVSCTGVLLPSLDAYIANDLGFRSDVRRLPITELGCAAGAAALAHARDFVLAHPGANVLVLAVELPTLSFQREDLTAANLISTALFGDGAAAALVTGREVPGARIVATRSHLFPNSLDALGFDLRTDGFHVVLARELPGIVRGGIARLVSELLADGGVSRAELAAFVLHPGGRRILEAISEELALAPSACQPSWDVLREYGNLSSASVLFVLHDWLTARRPARGSCGLVSAFGPGLTAELLLVRWN